MCMCSSLCRQPCPSRRRCSFSKEIHLNGCGKLFRRCILLRGRKATPHLASAFQARTLPWLTFGTRRSIIERDPFARSTRSCLRNMVFRTRNRCSLEAFCRPWRDSAHCASLCPALKRWAIVELAWFESLCSAVRALPTRAMWMQFSNQEVE